jgi:simple sugar transport system permease protein
MYAAPLILAGLGGVISEKSGVVNLALEGIMTIGAFAGAAVAYATGNVWLGFFAAGAAGGMLALLHAIATVTLKADQTISGVALNFIGPGLAVFLSRIIFGAVRSNPVPVRMPRLNVGINLDSTVIVALVLVFAMYIFLYKTKWGLRIIAVGEHPAAADTLGINVNATRFFCVLASGVFAGFGGAAFTLSIVSIFAPNTIAGAGFIALAAVIFGKWTPHGLLGACLIFGFFQALTILLRGYDLPVPLQVITILPYVLTLIILVLFVGKSVAPKAVGVPYKKGAH